MLAHLLLYQRHPMPPISIEECVTNTKQQYSCRYRYFTGSTKESGKHHSQKRRWIVFRWPSRLLSSVHLIYLSALIPTHKAVSTKPLLGRNGFLFLRKCRINVDHQWASSAKERKKRDAAHANDERIPNLLAKIIIALMIESKQCRRPK